MFWKRKIRLLPFCSKRADGILSKVGSRTSGYRVGNHESHSLGIGMSQTVNRLQSEFVNSRRCEPIQGANLSQAQNRITYSQSSLQVCVLLRVRLLLGLRAAAKPELRATSSNQQNRFYYG